MSCSAGPVLSGLAQGPGVQPPPGHGAGPWFWIPEPLLFLCTGIHPKGPRHLGGLDPGRSLPQPREAQACISVLAGCTQGGRTVRALVPATTGVRHS